MLDDLGRSTKSLDRVDGRAILPGRVQVFSIQHFFDDSLHVRDYVTVIGSMSGVQLSRFFSELTQLSLLLENLRLDNFLFFLQI